MPILFKDGVPENTHPLNMVLDASRAEVESHQVERIPLFEVYMRMAEELAKRSTCARLQVGTVITDGDSCGWTRATSKRSWPWKVSATMRQV